MRRYKSSTLVAMADAALLTAKMSDVQALLFVSLQLHYTEKVPMVVQSATHAMLHKSCYIKA